MALQSVQVRPEDSFACERYDELETFIESLINQPVRSTFSKVPVFSFNTTEENVKKIKDTYGNNVSVETTKI